MSTTSDAIAKAVAATAAVMMFLAGIFFYLLHKFAVSRYRQRHKVAASFLKEVSHEDIKKGSGNVKGFVVEENGIDVLYVESDGRQLKTRFSKNWFNPSFDDCEEGKKINVTEQSSFRFTAQEIPLLTEDLAKPSSTSPPPTQEVSESNQPKVLENKTTTPPPPPPPPPPPLLPPPLPPLSPPRKEVPRVPLKPSSLPPPPPKASGFTSTLKPSLAAKEWANMSQREKGGDPKRLKPLHWDKVVANVDHSTVWDQINDGSFRFDDQLIETLFGYSTNNKTHERYKGLSTNSNSNSPSQIFILDPRKSQNTAIVLKSLAISRNGILEALLDGQGLSADTLERLTKIAPTPEEAAKINHFNGNTEKLADAESFLYFILKAVPSAFTRLNAMLFRSSYDSEVLQLKENLQTLEMGCKELRNSGLFIKLLEAILKAGNRMNAGTSRGNAQGFNLSSLRKLSDVKSSDGKISLLHFIVEQVVQSEGRREAMYQKQNLVSDREREYLMLGSPVLKGLSDELFEVKKAATIEHHSFISVWSTLNAHVTEIRQIMTCCDDSERGGFIKEMKGFLKECEEELQVVKEDQTRVMELVKKTNEYYLAGGFEDSMSNSNPFQLFYIVKAFVDMVDQACLELKKKLEKKNVGVEAVLSTPPLSPSRKMPLRFPNFDFYFLSNMPGTTSSSQSEDDF